MTNERHIYPVILCGGSGTRLWPLSRKSFPKQFAQLMDETSLFQRAATLACGEGFAPPLVVTGDPFRFIVLEQLDTVGQKPTAVLIEPEGRNTAPAVLAAALALAQQAPDALMLILPSDHLIPGAGAFRATVRAAAGRADAGDLVTFGIEPTRPETGYGYLELTDPAARSAAEPQSLVRFVEKPDAAHAAEMLASGRYLWNAGIFLFSVRAIIEAYRAHAPELLDAVSAAVDAGTTDLGFTRLGAQAWGKAQAISIDYAIMEKASNLAVMPFSAGWSDLGDWKSVWQESGPDAQGNVCSAQATAIDCSNTLLRSEAGGLELVGIGLDEMIVVAMPDAVLVAPKSASQRVGEAVKSLKERGIRQGEAMPRDMRPWGWFESLAVGNGFQVKRIVVNPGQALSLQSHTHRAEHWIVVGGTAQVTIGDFSKLVSANESVYVPLGAVHRLENPGKIPVEMIEVQTGAYLGEDDIVRYEDRYARS
ncbi:mannose-1-phosphate guanylyltransferase/mannose-6-phosphate isomerase [Sphingobium fluviale]|uniref:mannose-1-phosphate guanylyltransferase n=1 Tax=Sphingobium fluviale TaxID=2506423 RepID=A0A4Q1KGC2_9SPHN|nr:mannose-1-phosphate guanylyltransferase/mannose-6-phosphate isomerase [Sphingobium fluviale]RXR28355.1 mannose-1-phosphate guanylyltransferase/mannose-6-phosphate isomerase [Sphingobium fluviale]